MGFPLLPVITSGLFHTPLSVQVRFLLWALFLPLQVCTLIIFMYHTNLVQDSVVMDSVTQDLRLVHHVSWIVAVAVCENRLVNDLV